MSGRYKAYERGRYEPTACPGCHCRVSVDWLDVTSTSDPEHMFMPGRWWCQTPECAYNPDGTAA